MKFSLLFRPATFAIILFALCFPNLAQATSASISVSGNEGAIPVTASATFSAYKRCDGNTPPTCWMVDNGILRVYQNNQYIGGSSGEGSAEWSDVRDGGLMRYGEHIFKAVATDADGVTSTKTKTIFIDNTPELTLEVGDPEGDMEIHGTVDFKEVASSPRVGYIRIYLIHPNGNRVSQGAKYFEGAESKPWTWQEITGRVPDAGLLKNGDYTIQVIATAMNGDRQQVEKNITIDNTPQLTLEVGDTEGDMEIGGTVDFKEVVTTPREGLIRIYLIHPNGNRISQGAKYFEGAEPTPWTWQGVTGRAPDAGLWRSGDYTIQVIATATNGDQEVVEQTVTIDNTPKLTLEIGDTEGDLEIGGTVDFKEVVTTPREGLVRIYLIHPNGNRVSQGAKYFEGAEPTPWTWQGITSRAPDAGLWRSGDYTIQVIATATNGDQEVVEQTVTIDNTPKLTLEIGDTEGDMEIGGTVDFKEVVTTPREGLVRIYLIHPNGNRVSQGAKYFEGAEPTPWTWQGITSRAPDAGLWRSGDYTIQVIATATNGDQEVVEQTVTIDNTPKLTLEIGDTEGDMEIGGTVDFKEVVTTPREGFVRIYLIHPNGNRVSQGLKYIEDSESIPWTWQGVTGRTPDAGLWRSGDYTIQVIAIATNGDQEVVEQTVTIDNTPKLTLEIGDTEGDMEIGGTVDFKEVVTTPREGFVRIYLIHPTGSRVSQGLKYIEDSESIPWTWQEVTGRIPDAGTWRQGQYTIQVVATATNGDKELAEQTITIDNTPELTPIGQILLGDNFELMDLFTKVTFKEHTGGAEGTVSVLVNGRVFGSNSFEGVEHDVSYEDLRGQFLNTSGWAINEDDRIVFRARAYNGVTAEQHWPEKGNNNGPPQCPRPNY